MFNNAVNNLFIADTRPICKIHDEKMVIMFVNLKENHKTTTYYCPKCREAAEGPKPQKEWLAFRDGI